MKIGSYQPEECQARAKSVRAEVAIPGGQSSRGTYEKCVCARVSGSRAECSPTLEEFPGGAHGGCVKILFDANFNSSHRWLATPDGHTGVLSF